MNAMVQASISQARAQAEAGADETVGGEQVWEEDSTGRRTDGLWTAGEQRLRDDSGLLAADPGSQ